MTFSPLFWGVHSSDGFCTRAPLVALLTLSVRSANFCGETLNGVAVVRHSRLRYTFRDTTGRANRHCSWLLALSASVSRLYTFSISDLVSMYPLAKLPHTFEHFKIRKMHLQCFVQNFVCSTSNVGTIIHSHFDVIQSSYSGFTSTC